MPDLNSVPVSPRPLAARRQSSKDVIPSGLPADASLNILPSNQSAVNPTTSSTPTGESPQFSSSQPHPAVANTRDSSTEAGPGPTRHPRPLTAAELHTEVEKEHEALVNRLQRELSYLRIAHDASLLSHLSSTSAATPVPELPLETVVSASAFPIPSSSRHHRTSSSASQQFSALHDGRRPPYPPWGMHRRDSLSSRRSRAGSPGPTNNYRDDATTYFQQQRMPQTAGNDQLSPGMMPGTARFEEAQQAKSELEAVKKENELLKKNIRDLEKAVREKRLSQESSRPRSESASTSASMNAGPSGAGIAGSRDRGTTAQSTTNVPEPVGVSEVELEVGESAASSGWAHNIQREQ